MAAYIASYMRMYLTPPFLIFSSSYASILSLAYCKDMLWCDLHIMLLFFKCFFYFLFSYVARLSKCFHIDGCTRTLSADLNSCGLCWEHGVNSRHIRFVWVCSSGVWSVCLTVCFAAGMSSVNPSSLSLTQIRSAVWVICVLQHVRLGVQSHKLNVCQGVSALY